MEHSLQNIRVIDASGGLAGAFCAKLLASAGADVVAADFGRGEPAGKWPWRGDGEKHGIATLYHYLRSETQMAYVGNDDSARDRLMRLISVSDIVIRSHGDEFSDFVPPVTDATDRIVATLVGQRGIRNWLAADLVSYAGSGAAATNGRPGRAPLKGSGYQASFLSGAAACVGILGLLHRRYRTGQGGSLHLSATDSLLCAYAPSVLSTQYTGMPPAQRTGGFPAGPIQASDGAVVLTVSRAHFWRDAMNALGLAELAESEPFYDPLYRQEHYAEVAPIVEERVARWRKDDLFHALSEIRVTVGKVMNVQELWDDPHLRARGFVNDDARTIGAPFKMSRTPLQATDSQDHIRTTGGVGGLQRPEDGDH